MSYANVCSPQNIQSYHDDYFHTISFDEITSFVEGFADKRGCGTSTQTGNSAPVVEAGPNYTIPITAPFILNGSATDPDGDTLTYSWEEFDLGSSWTGSPSLPNKDSDGNARPILRSYPPLTITWRIFPKLSSILDGSYSNLGESLPNISRSMQFRLTARDNKGGVAYDAMTVTVDSSAGPFRVTAPNTNVAWTLSTLETITWDVANTNLAPINCTNVNILYSTFDS